MNKYELAATVTTVVGLLLLILGFLVLVPRCDATRMEACAKMCGVGNARLGTTDGGVCTCITPARQP